MKKEIKVESVVAAYSLLKEARISKIENDLQKFAIIKALRVLKPIAVKFDSDRQDAIEKLKGSNHDVIIAKALKWQKEGNGSTLTNEERIEVNTYINKFSHDVSEALKEESEKVVEVELTALTDESMGQLIASNEGWTAAQALELAELMCE